MERKITTCFFKCSKIVLSLFFFVCFCLSVLPFPVSADEPVAALSFLPKPMSDTGGEVKVYMRLRVLNAALEEDFAGIDKLEFSVAYDSDIYELKTDKATGSCFFITDEDPDVAGRIDFTETIRDEASFSVKVQTDSMSFIKSGGIFGYFVLIAKQPKKLYNSDDLYPLRFIDKSVYLTFRCSDSDEICRIHEIVGSSCMVGGYTPDPPPRIEPGVLTEYSVQDVAWRDKHLPPPTPPEEVKMAVGTAKMVSDGVTTRMDAVPYVDENDGQIMAPIRFLSYGMGLSVDWIDALDTVVITGEDKRILMTVGETFANEGGEIVETGTALVKKENRVFTAVEFLAEKFGYSVELKDGEITFQNRFLEITP